MGRGHEQPRQSRIVDEPNPVAVAPRLEKGDGDGVIRVGGGAHQSKHVAVDTVTVSVEDTAERFTLPGEGEGPVCGVSGHTCIVRCGGIGSPFVELCRPVTGALATASNRS